MIYCKPSDSLLSTGDSSGLSSSSWRPKTRTQQGVLGLLFGQPTRSFYASEIISLVGAGSGTVQRELARLEESGLISVRRIGSQKHYQANAESPLYKELHGIVLKTVAIAEPLRIALNPLASEIVAAFVYGSIAKGKDTSASDMCVR